MKDAYYFPHDYNAHNDPKLVRLAMNGWDLVGLYWAIIEMLHEQGGWMDINPEPISFSLRASNERITTVLNFPNVFIIRDGKFTSQRVLNNLKYRQLKSEKARKSIETRWNKGVIDNTNVIRTNKNKNTNVILERKGKERKGNNSVVFIPPSLDEVSEYCLSRGNSIDAEAFIAYYTARGWKFGTGKPVKDWKSCVITWEKRDRVATGQKEEFMEGFK